MKDTRKRTRIKLEDGSVIHCHAEEIPRLADRRRKARMDISMYRIAYMELTGKELPEPMIV